MSPRDIAPAIQILIRITMLLVVATGCGQFDQKSQSKKSDAEAYAEKEKDALDFLTFSSGYTGAISYLKSETFNICLSGTQNSNDQIFRNWIQSSMENWLEPIRLLSSEISSEVRIVDKDEVSECHINFEVVTGQWGFTNLWEIPRIVVGPNVPYGVVFHEFGHALGLADTYENGTSGRCQPGQPQSLMCNISFDQLQQDDVDGITYIFKRVFPNEQPPQDNGIEPDQEEDSDEDDESDDPSDNKADIFMAFQKDADSDKVKLHFALHTDSLSETQLDEITNSRMIICVNRSDVSSCKGSDIIKFAQVNRRIKQATGIVFYSAVLDQLDQNEDYSVRVEPSLFNHAKSFDLSYTQEKPSTTTEGQK